MNPNQKFYLQSAGVNDGLIVVNGTEHVFDIPTLPKTLEEWKKEYTYRQYQVIAKHHLSICARTMKEMSLPTRVVEEWKRIDHLVMKDPACRNLFAPPAPVITSTKSPGDESKSASSIVIASKPKPSQMEVREELDGQQPWEKENKRLKETNAFLKIEVEMKKKELDLKTPKLEKLKRDNKRLRRKKAALEREVRELKQAPQISALPSVPEKRTFTSVAFSAFRRFKNKF